MISSRQEVFMSQQAQIIANTSMQTNYIQGMTNATSDAQVIAMWLSDKSKTSVKTYIGSIKQFFDFINLPLQDLKIDDIFLYRSSLVQRGYKPQTVTNKLMGVKSLITFAHKIGYIHFNVGSIVRGMRDQDHLNEKIITPQEIHNLLSVIDNPQHRIMVRTLVNTGLRITELCNLKWTDLRDNLLTVKGKGDRTRVLTLSEDLLRDILWLYRPYYTYIFSTKNGTPISRSHAHDYLKRYLHKAGLNEDISCHWLRHTFASTALANGADLLLVSKSLGHSNISTTSRYLHTIKTECATDYVDF
jgi:integrase/recombinase XerD